MAQIGERRERFPTYFGLQIRPVLPTRFIGKPKLALTNEEFSTIITQKVGYSFGGSVRSKVTRLISFETGINFTQRMYNIAMSIPDSTIHVQNTLSFIEYDVPLNVLTSIQLSKAIFMNAALGFNLTYKPSSVGTRTLPGGKFDFTHTGFVTNKGGIDFNANFGFEYRTENRGFIYLGGGARVPFRPVFEMVARYKYDGYKKTVTGSVDGTFLTIELKYFFPIIQKQVPQFHEGPIE